MDVKMLCEFQSHAKGRAVVVTGITVIIIMAIIIMIKFIEGLLRSH